MRSHIIILAAAALLAFVGCVVVHDPPTARTAPRPPSPKPYDPLPVAQGWKGLSNTLEPAIIDDYTNYISKLPKGQQRRLDTGGIRFFSNTNGQQAVSFNTEAVFLCWISTWNYVLIYDGNHKRIKVLEHKIGTSLNIEM